MVVSFDALFLCLVSLSLCLVSLNPLRIVLECIVVLLHYCPSVSSRFVSSCFKFCVLVTSAPHACSCSPFVAPATHKWLSCQHGANVWKLIRMSHAVVFAALLDAGTES